MTARHAIIATPLGDVTVVANGDALTGLYFPHHWYLPDETEFGPLVDADADPLLAETATQLNDYLQGARPGFDLRFVARGDAFQERVWALLNEIPYGQTTTYGELASRLGDRALAQTVGQAVGRNPLSVLVPCHRVVGRNGKLTGYAGGLERKKFLLDLEEPAEVRAAKLF